MFHGFSRKSGNHCNSWTLMEFHGLWLPAKTEILKEYRRPISKPPRRRGDLHYPLLIKWDGVWWCIVGPRWRNLGLLQHISRSLLRTVPSELHAQLGWHSRVICQPFCVATALHLWHWTGSTGLALSLWCSVFSDLLWFAVLCGWTFNIFAPISATVLCRTDSLQFLGDKSYIYILIYSIQ